MEITLNGSVMLGQDGKLGVFFEPTGKKRPIDSGDDDYKDEKVIEVKENMVVIWCESLASARVLQDAVNILALKLNGREVTDK